MCKKNTTLLNLISYWKKIALALICLCPILSINAQVPQSINYQTLIRDPSGQPLANQAVSLQFTILQNTIIDGILYRETHTTTSNAQGLVNLEIGNGVVSYGDFSTIDWVSFPPISLAVELDPDGAGAQPFTYMGSQNLASVPYALYSENTSRVRTNGTNLAVGITDYNLGGNNNTANGSNALRSNTIGSSNTANGGSTLYSNTTGSSNTATGYDALAYNTTGSENTAHGASTLRNNTEGINNTAAGYGALYENIIGNDNTASGWLALRDNTGSDNTATGSGALRYNTTGRWNTAVGKNALYSNTTGGDNVAIGINALYNNGTPIGGKLAGILLKGSPPSYLNVAIGRHALYSNTTGTLNTANGSYALSNNTTGWHNTALGAHTLGYNIDGDGNTCLGHGANVSVSNLNNASSLGTFAVTNSDNKIVIGDVTGMTIGGYANWSNLSDGRFKQNVQNNVPGLTFIAQLQPVTYTIDIAKLQRHITAQMPDSIARQYLPNAQQITQAQADIRTGFIAQDVETVAKKIGYAFDGVNAPQNPTDNYSIEYAGFVPSLVKAIQEQQAIIEKLQQQNTDLQKQIDELKVVVNKK